MEKQKQYKNPSYMHFKTDNGGVVTAAIEVKAENDEPKAYVGLAFCSPEDQFQKKLGRTISSGRLQAGKPFFEFKLNPERRVKRQVQEILDRHQLSGGKGFPKWLKQIGG